MEERPGSIENSTQKRKFHNLLFSEQFCGLCFECSDGINTNFQLEIVTFGRSYPIKLGDVYTSVFKKSSEDLASKIICNTCTDHLIQSYTFIKNSTFTFELLNGYIKDLDSKTEELVTHFKNTELKSNICIVLESNFDIENGHGTSWTTKKDEENINKTSLSKKERKEIRIRGSCQKQLVSSKVLNLTHISQMRKFKLNHADQRERPKFRNSVKIERIQCVTCLKDIKDSQDHICQFKCPECIEHSCKHFVYLKHYSEQLSKNIEAKCRDCSFKCRNKDTLIDHVNKHHLDLQACKCNFCSQTFQSKPAIQAHMSRCRNTGCTETLKKNEIELLKLNNLNVLRARNSKQVGHLLTCHVCGKLVREAIFKKHVENHVMSCNKCDKSFAKINLLKYHQKSHLDDVACPTCKKPINPSKLKQHMKSHTEDSQIIVKKSKANIKCDLCEYITWNSILLECHMNRHHLKIKPYVCHICSKNFVGKHLLKKHIKFHTANRSVICAICGKTLANSDCLKIHLRLHTGERNYPCDICGERFRSASIRNVHKVKKHCERKAACPLCPSNFHTLVELRRHVIKIHWKKDTKFDPRQLEGLEKHYHLFHDGRRIRMGDQDIDFYMPC